MLRTEQARVFSRRLRSEVLDGREDVFFGCLYRTRRAFSLRQSDDYCGVTSVERPSLRLTGRFVAFVQVVCYADTQFPFVTVRDLASGRKVRDGSAGAYGRIGMVKSVVLKGNGSVAWTASGFRPGAGNPYDSQPTNLVLIADRRGRRLVAEGNGIDLGSLSLTANHTAITFVQDGELRSVPID